MVYTCPDYTMLLSDDLFIQLIINNQKSSIMKRLSYSNFSALLLALFFVVGIQSTSQAQITVSNFTGCDIVVYVGQYDLQTLQPCDLCPINPPTPILIQNGDTQDIFGQDVCGETFGWLAWQIQGAAGFGLSSNPGLFSPVACVNNIPGPLCNAFANTQAFWLSSGAGPVEVFIF